MKKVLAIIGFVAVVAGIAAAVFYFCNKKEAELEEDYFEDETEEAVEAAEAAVEA